MELLKPFEDKMFYMKIKWNIFVSSHNMEVNYYMLVLYKDKDTELNRFYHR